MVPVAPTAMPKGSMKGAPDATLVWTPVVGLTRMTPGSSRSVTTMLPWLGADISIASAVGSEKKPDVVVALIGQPDVPGLQAMGGLAPFAFAGFTLRMQPE